MDFTKALDLLITEALESEDGPSLEEVVFALGQAELNLRMAVALGDEDEADDAAE
jgi:hypothetical protein